MGHGSAPPICENGEHVHYRRRTFGVKCGHREVGSQSVLQSKREAQPRLGMSARFLVDAAFKLSVEDFLDQALGFGVAWSDLIRRGMAKRI